ncbi:MAG: hypothetical protein H0U00_10240 [Actinobacteria bacterium]|nr:hypothetical protein [Actinomycetota bacterium]
MRRTLDIGALGINAYTAPNPGDDVVEEHTEQTYGHEEVYVVLKGGSRHAARTIGLAATRLTNRDQTENLAPVSEVRRRDARGRSQPEDEGRLKRPDPSGIRSASRGTNTRRDSAARLTDRGQASA